MAGERVQFPAFCCPNPACGARRIIFAANRAEKNRARLFLYDQMSDRSAVEYVILCPKCRQKIAICDMGRMMPAVAAAT